MECVILYIIDMIIIEAINRRIVNKREKNTKVLLE